MNQPLSTLTPADLNAAFAVEVAGWRYCPATGFMPPVWEPKEGGWTVNLPDFQGSMDALAPWLEEYRKANAFACLDIHCNWTGWEVRIFQAGDDDAVCAKAATQARAACEALLAWKRASTTPTSET